MVHEMLYQAVCHHARNCQVTKQLSRLFTTSQISCSELNVKSARWQEQQQALPLELTASEQSQQVLLNQLVKMVYDVRRDDDGIFRQQLNSTLWL